jgi:hypothetical protein
MSSRATTTTREKKAFFNFGKSDAETQGKEEDPFFLEEEFSCFSSSSS